MKTLIIALGFLTRLPMPRVEADEVDFARAIRLYPVAGLVVGVIVAGAGWLGAHVDPWTGALAALIAWVWATGALHLDGLADLSDGLGAAHGDRSRLLAVMADPHIGSFGVVALAMQLIAKLVLLHGLPVGAWPMLALIPAAARVRAAGLGAPVAALTPRRAGRDGRKGDTAGRHDRLDAGRACAWPVLSAAGGRAFIILTLSLWFRRKLGGMTGDVHGAGIELTETALLLAAVLYALP